MNLELSDHKIPSPLRGGGLGWWGWISSGLPCKYITFFILFLGLIGLTINVSSQERLPEKEVRFYNPHHLKPDVLIDVLVPLYPSHDVLFSRVGDLDRILVEGTPDRLPAIMDLIQNLDQPPAQVSLAVEVISAGKGSLRPHAPDELKSFAQALKSFSSFSRFESIGSFRFESLEMATSKFQVQQGLTLEMRVEQIDEKEKTATISYDLFEQREGTLRTLLHNTCRISLEKPTVQGAAQWTRAKGQEYLLLGLELRRVNK